MTLRLRILVLLLCALFGLTTCRKGGEPVVRVPHGMAWGSFAPSFAMARVTATAPGGTPIAAPLEASGSYYFDSLAVGPYTLAFEPVDGYLTPPTQPLLITDGATSSPVPVLLVRNTATRLTGRRWRLSAFTATPGGGVAQDAYAALPGCVRDDFFVLQPDGGGNWDEGPSQCPSTAPQTSPLTWQLRENDTELWLDPLGPGPNPYRIEQLTPTTLTVRYYPDQMSMTVCRKTFTTF